LLGASAKAGVGAAGLALVGCGDDDDDAAVAQAQTQAQAQAQAQAEEQVQAPAGEEPMEEQQVPVFNPTPGDFDGLQISGTLTSVDLFPREPPSLDPFIETSFLAQQIGTNIYSRLLKFGSGPGIKALATIKGDAAETFEAVDADGLEWVFSLRDMPFHQSARAGDLLGGRSMDAEDVTASFERFRTDSANFKLFELVDSLEAVDSRTLKFTLGEPFAGFLENLASPSGLFVMSKEANHGEIDPAKDDGLIGTGPYQFENLRPAVEVVFKRNPNWYEKVITPAGVEFSAPLHERVVHIIQTEYATRFALFVDGTADFWDMDGNNRDLGTMIEQVPEVQVVPSKPGWLFAGYQFNQTSENGLWRDPRARIAISHAIDRAGLIEAFGEVSLIERDFGATIPTGWGTLVPWGKGGEFWQLDPQAHVGESWADNFSFDPARGRQLLEAAGYDGSAVDMNYLQATYGTVYDQFTEAQLPMLADIGLNIDSQIREYAQQWSSEASRDFPGLYYNYVTPFGTIDEYMQLWFSPDNDDVRHPAQRKIRTAEIDALVASQRQEFDRAARQEMVHEVIRQASDIMNVVHSPRIGWGSNEVAQPWIRSWDQYDSAGYGWFIEELPYVWTERT
jgi:peptide/nickel transport system substrate-binding protein